MSSRPPSPHLNPNLQRSLQYYQKGVLQPEAWFRVVEHDYTQLIAAINWKKSSRNSAQTFSCWTLAVVRDVFQKCSNPNYPQRSAFSTIISTPLIIVWPPANRLSDHRFSHGTPIKLPWNMPRRSLPQEPMTSPGPFSRCIVSNKPTCAQHLNSSSKPFIRYVAPPVWCWPNGKRFFLKSIRSFLNTAPNRHLRPISQQNPW